MGKHTVIRKRAGNHTPSGKWYRLCDFDTLDGTGWVIYARDNGERYLGVKVAVVGEILGKANYWMTWDRQQRNLFRQHAGELQRQRNDVFNLATQYLRLVA